MLNYENSNITAGSPLRAFCVCRDVTVILVEEDTGNPASGLMVGAMTQNGAMISQGEETDLDGTYLLKGVNQSSYLIYYGVNGTMNAEFVAHPVDTITFKVHPKYLPLKPGEVEVNADNQYMSVSKSVYVPTKRDKKISHGGPSLINTMGIPSLYVDPMNESITTTSGQQVGLFIDYVPATQQDIANLRPMDVKRVELLESPSDPRFRGADYVLNFVMVRYEYGGYTKLDANQYLITNLGTYGVNSKLTKGRYTYDAAANFHYDKYSHAGADQTSVYRFPSLEITKEQTIQSTRNSSRSGYGTLQASYSSDKALITNTLGINISKIPYASSGYSGNFCPAGIFADGIENTFSSNKSVSPSWKGSYLWNLPKKFSLTIDPKFSYGRHESNTHFSSYDADITTMAHENNINYSLAIAAQKQIGKHTVGLRLGLGGFWDEITYSGSTSSSNTSTEIRGGIGPSVFLIFGKGWLKGNINIKLTHTSFGDYSKNQASANGYIAAGYTLRNKHKFNLVANLTQWTVPVRQQMPSFVLTSQIGAIMGNEALKEVLYIPVNFNYQWLMSKVVSLSLFASYSHSSKPITDVYLPAELNSLPLMVLTYDNCGSYNEVSYGGAVNLRLFNNSFVLRGGINGNYASRHGGINRSGSYLAYNFNANYSLKNFYCAVSYQSQTRSVGLASYNKVPNFYYIGLGWSNGNFNAGAYLINPFNSAWKSSYFESGDRNFSKCSQSYSITYHRQISLRVVYSFSYGKKVQQTESIGSLSGTESGIVK